VILTLFWTSVGLASQAFHEEGPGFEQSISDGWESGEFQKEGTHQFEFEDNIPDEFLLLQLIDIHNQSLGYI
jgi:hypothetical protein